MTEFFLQKRFLLIHKTLYNNKQAKLCNRANDIQINKNSYIKKKF